MFSSFTYQLPSSFFDSMSSYSDRRPNERKMKISLGLNIVENIEDVSTRLNKKHNSGRVVFGHFNAEM